MNRYLAANETKLRYVLGDQMFDQLAARGRIMGRTVDLRRDTTPTPKLPWAERTWSRLVQGGGMGLLVYGGTAAFNGIGITAAVAGASVGAAAGLSFYRMVGRDKYLATRKAGLKFVMNGVAHELPPISLTEKIYKMVQGKVPAAGRAGYRAEIERELRKRYMKKPPVTGAREILRGGPPPVQ